MIPRTVLHTQHPLVTALISGRRRVDGQCSRRQEKLQCLQIHSASAACMMVTTRLFLRHDKPQLTTPQFIPTHTTACQFLSPILTTNFLKIHINVTRPSPFLSSKFPFSKTFPPPKLCKPIHFVSPYYPHVQPIVACLISLP